MDIRKLMEIERTITNDSFQVTISNVLKQSYGPKLQIFRLCAVIANKTGNETRELYLAAINADKSSELSDILPQIDPELPIPEALETLTKLPIDKAWVTVDSAGYPNAVYLEQQDVRTEAMEIPIKRRTP